MVLETAYMKFEIEARWLLNFCEQSHIAYMKLRKHKKIEKHNKKEEFFAKNMILVSRHSI
jgi:hypothetical protein